MPLMDRGKRAVHTYQSHIPNIELPELRNENIFYVILPLVSPSPRQHFPHNYVGHVKQIFCIFWNIFKQARKIPFSFRPSIMKSDLWRIKIYVEIQSCQNIAAD
jgi:hypothetical protein